MDIIKPTVLQENKKSIRPCTTYVPPKYFLRDFRINIDYPRPWYIDTTGNVPVGSFDFYHAKAHEFGHAHLIEHINDSLSNLMFWGANNLGTIESQRKRVWTSYSAMDGGDWVTANLSSALLGCTTMHTLYYPSDCTGMGIENICDEILNVYPNPNTDGLLNITLNTNNQNVSYQLFDNLGRFVKSTSTLVSNQKEVLDIFDLSNGVYFLNICIDNKNNFVKIIKQ